ncbi:hypothetical protein VKT23_016739 [Stygiomarasmius scandens]|uniref:Uncharacterized protein n=1 Tax=Marasmiellus scandens TaxID=2682957 RepID=A0ABR1IU14_9AGAR
MKTSTKHETLCRSISQFQSHCSQRSTQLLLRSPPGPVEKADAAAPSLAQYHTVDIPDPGVTTSASQPTPQTTAKSSSAWKDAKPPPNVAGKDEYQPESWTPTARLRVKRGQ